MALNSVKLQKVSEENLIEDEPTMLSLAAHVKKCYDEAKSAKTDITERLLRCERQRRGEYDPDKLAMIRDTGGSDIYMMLTDIKCRAAESWIKDVMLNAGEKSWSLRPTKEPDVPDELRDEIIETVVIEAAEAGLEDGQFEPQVVKVRMEEIYEEVKKRLKHQVQESAMKMEDRILDKMQDAKFNDIMSEVIYDFVTFPTSFVKGPIVRKKKKMGWGKNWTPKVEEAIVEDFERVSPYDIFPSPNATTCQDGYIIQRHQLTRGDLDSMRSAPQFDKEAIEQALYDYGNRGIREMIQSDSERNLLQGRNNSLSGTDVIEAIEFWGPVSGRMLEEWGMDGLDEYKEYEVNVWICGEHILKAALNVDPLTRRPYSKASWEAIPGAFWGLGLPEMMRDVQSVCNAAARALANNMGIASGPQVEVSVDRLPDGEDLTQMYPWKIWQTTSDRTGGGQRAVNFFQPNMNADTLLNVYQFFQKVSDEVTGVPNYVYGSANVSGAGRTASGLSMLMENAAKGLKQAILSLDGAVSNVIHRLYDHIMIYDPDDSIKGDMQIVPAGVVGTLLKESVQARRNEFLQMTANPVDLQIMGPAGRAALLREAAKVLNMDVDQLVPDPKDIKEQQKQAEMQQQAMLEEQMMAQQGAPMDQQLPVEGM
jgi:hypothetical protein